MQNNQPRQDIAISVSDPESIKNELHLINPVAISVEGEPDSQLDQQAEIFTKAILAFNPDDPNQIDNREQNIVSVETLGSKVQKEAAHRSNMLKEPIRKLAARGEDGGAVANALVNLKDQVEELNPGRFDFKAGWFSRTLGRLPGVGTPLKKYFTRFESAQTVVEAIIRSLEEGRDILNRDNITLSQDQKMMRGLTINLNKTIQLGLLVDQKLSYALEREIGPDDPRRRFIEDELLFPLRQRIQDLQQQLAVNQQGVLAIEIIIRNNKELVKGVARGINVTVNALTVAVTVAWPWPIKKSCLTRLML